MHTDNDMSTKFAWARPHPLSSESTATVTWRVPAEAAPGTYRLRTFGDSKGMFGSTTPFSGTSGVRRSAGFLHGRTPQNPRDGRMRAAGSVVMVQLQLAAACRVSVTLCMSSG